MYKYDYVCATIEDCVYDGQGSEGLELPSTRL